MVTFKKFLEADGNLPNGGVSGGGSAPLNTQPDPTSQEQQPQQPQQRPRQQLKGSLTDAQQRVLAILSANAIKSSPGRARQLLSGRGDENTVRAVTDLKTKFNAIDVKPDGVMINQTGTTLAAKFGITDPNSGELTDLGIKLATTLPSGAPNPKTKDLGNAGGAPGGQPPGGIGGDPAMGMPPGQGMPPMESYSLIRKMLG